MLSRDSEIPLQLTIIIITFYLPILGVTFSLFYRLTFLVCG